MSLFDTLRKQYTIKAKCSNCNHIFELKIPKGTTIENYLKSEACACENCGCATLVKISI
jgi:DNA-directed RNA polymerase subunit RPC12/RpoP